MSLIFYFENLKNDAKTICYNKIENHGNHRLKIMGMRCILL